MVEIWTRFGHHRPTPTKALLTYTWQRCCHKINQNWSKNDQNWWTRFGQHHPTHTNTILTYTRVLQICSHKISFLLKIKIDKFMIVYMGKELRKIWLFICNSKVNGDNVVAWISFDLRRLFVQMCAKLYLSFYRNCTAPGRQRTNIFAQNTKVCLIFYPTRVKISSLHSQDRNTDEDAMLIAWTAIVKYISEWNWSESSSCWPLIRCNPCVDETGIVRVFFRW